LCDIREGVSDGLRLILSGNTQACNQRDALCETFHGTAFPVVEPPLYVTLFFPLFRFVSGYIDEADMDGSDPARREEF
jgi:hypothetical protein